MRLHTGAEAAAAAQAEHAHAFAAGRDIYFGQRAWDPNSSEGLHVLVHEIAHVLQQTGRQGLDKRIKATVQESTGDVQRSPVPWTLKDTPANNALKALAQKHWDAWSEDAISRR